MTSAAASPFTPSPVLSRPVPVVRPGRAQRILGWLFVFGLGCATAALTLVLVLHHLHLLHATPTGGGG
jgi:hypothetical protein